MKLVRLVRNIGTTLAISVYTDKRGVQEWKCWLDDPTLRFAHGLDSERITTPRGYGSTMDGTLNELVEMLRGKYLIRTGQDKEDKYWHVPKTLTA